MYAQKNLCVTDLVILATLDLDSWDFLHKIGVLQLHTGQADPFNVIVVKGRLLGCASGLTSNARFEQKGKEVWPFNPTSLLLIHHHFQNSIYILSYALPLVKPGSSIFSDLPSTRTGMLNLIRFNTPIHTDKRLCMPSMILTFSPPHPTVSSSMMVISLLVNCLTFLPTPTYLPFLLPTSWNLPDHSEISIYLLWNILSFLVQYPLMI